MEENLRREVIARLKRDYQMKETPGGETLYGGVCPACGKKELYARAANPAYIYCSRRNKCDHRENVREIYKDLFGDWSKRYRPTPENPNATADAYLRDDRGFSIGRMAGWYTQENHVCSETGAGTATVRFSLPPGPNGQRVWWERFLDDTSRFPKGQKCKTVGPFGGQWWIPRTLNLDRIEELWLVEGIFDAIALWHHDIPAAAILSSGTYPSRALADLKAARGTRELPTLVWALDGDKAGQDATKRHVERAEKDGWACKAALIPRCSNGKRMDWSDAHISRLLEERHIKEYRYHGSLLLAKNARERGSLEHAFTGRTSFPFTFENELYWLQFDTEKFQKRKEFNILNGEREDDAIEKAREETIQVDKVANCAPRALYHMHSDIQDESYYYFRVDLPGGASARNIFSPGQLATNPEFKKRLLNIGLPGAFWKGAQWQLDWLVEGWTSGLKHVQTTEFVGYAEEHGAYLFPTLAAKDGRIYELNNEDYFDIGKQGIKTLQKSLALTLHATPPADEPDWFRHLTVCYSTLGHVALAFWLGTLFAEQIRASFESFPFVEIVGEAGAGKSTLLEFLWKLFGRDGYEGFDPKKATSKGLLRAMEQVANLPVVLIEADRTNDSDSSFGRSVAPFEWDQFKSLYNGGHLRTTGMKTTGNETYTPRFRAALVISQNAPVEASRPMRERIIHLWFDKSLQSSAGRDHGLALGRLRAADVSGFLTRALMQEGKILALFKDRMRRYELDLQAAGVTNLRLQKNYAQLLCLVDALELVCPITAQQLEEARASVTDLALEREHTLSDDHPAVRQFWDVYDYLQGQPLHSRVNHSRDKSLIAINFNQFVKAASEHRQALPPIPELKSILRESRSRPFIRQGQVRSALHEAINFAATSDDQRRAETLFCWVFENRSRS